jgi:hypothetical protein
MDSSFVAAQLLLLLLLLGGLFNRSRKSNALVHGPRPRQMASGGRAEQTKTDQ